MEEVDKIILHSLRQIGCDIDEEITSLKKFDADMIVKASVKCLDLIQPGLNLPPSLPHNMAARYKVGQEIAHACSELGYPGDIGYQTFLYSGESDVRKILMFLIEKLPKEQEKFIEEPTGPQLLLRKIRNKIKEDMTRPWLPHTCYAQQEKQVFHSLSNIDEAPNIAWKEFWCNDATKTPSCTFLLPTVITLNSRGVLADNQPSLFLKNDIAKIHPHNSSKDYTYLHKFSQESIAAKRKPPLAPKPKILGKNEAVSEVVNEIDEATKTEERLHKEQEILTEQIQELAVEIEQLNLKKTQTAQDKISLCETLRKKREKNSMRLRILELMPDAESNIARLQEVIENSSQKLVQLASQWENHRLPLWNKYRDYSQEHNSKMSETVKKAETIKSLNEKRKELEIEVRTKDQLYGQLQAECDKISKDINRSAYTRRILEIITNIQKQKNEIDKVLNDTKEVQKEINTLSGQLERSFTVADETIFRDAIKDETSRKAYKLLATLHSDCDDLVAMVQETGAIVREIRDLEDQIEKESAKNVESNLERITADLKQMKAESAQLTAQLKLRQQAANATS